MFSGIVEETGKVVSIIHEKNLAVLSIKAKKIIPGTKQGDSISVDGVCLTITKKRKDVLSFDIMLETLKKTTLGRLNKGSQVNLERALKVSDRISGHFVSGHVDDLVDIKNVVLMKNYTELRIGLNKELSCYVVQKGSVCINGVSLTIGDVRKGSFSVYLIPFTLKVTNLGLLKKGSKVNIETDILAKYLFAQAESGKSPYSLSKSDIKVKKRK